MQLLLQTIMALSGGSREILEAARKRLSTAKTQATAASTNLESVKQMLVNAQSMSDAADKEVKDAQTALDEAEKKYEVIDIDQEPESPTAEGSNKRRKVSLSPQVLAVLSQTTSVSTDETSTTVGSQCNNIEVNRSAVNEETSSTTASTNINKVFEGCDLDSLMSNDSPVSSIVSNIDNGAFTISRVLVEGCGHPKVNGIYRKVQGLLHDGAPVYSKIGKWMGSQVTFGIYRIKSSHNYWYIGTFPHSINGIISSNYIPFASRLYKSNWNGLRRSKLVPPENGWVADARDARKQELPTCQLITNNDSPTVPNKLLVEGCGLKEANGLYELRSVCTLYGIPIYWKPVQFNGKKEIIAIHGKFDKHTQTWMITVVGKKKSLYKSVQARQRGDRLDESPTINSTSWFVKEGGKGVHPPPQMKSA